MRRALAVFSSDWRLELMMKITDSLLWLSRKENSQNCFAVFGISLRSARLLQQPASFYIHSVLIWGSIQSDTLYNIMSIICTTYNVQFWHCQYFPQRNFYKRLYEILSSSHKMFLKSILISASGEMKYQVLWLIRLQRNLQRKGLRRLT